MNCRPFVTDLVIILVMSSFTLKTNEAVIALRGTEIGRFSIHFYGVGYFIFP
jgi:hypothetical protein